MSLAKEWAGIFYFQKYSNIMLLQETYISICVHLLK